MYGGMARVSSAAFLLSRWTNCAEFLLEKSLCPLCLALAVVHRAFVYLPQVVDGKEVDPVNSGSRFLDVSWLRDIDRRSAASGARRVASNGPS